MTSGTPTQRALVARQLPHLREAVKHGEATLASLHAHLAEVRSVAELSHAAGDSPVAFGLMTGVLRASEFSVRLSGALDNLRGAIEIAERITKEKP